MIMWVLQPVFLNDDDQAILPQDEIATTGINITGAMDTLLKINHEKWTIEQMNLYHTLKQWKLEGADIFTDYLRHVKKILEKIEKYGSRETMLLDLDSINKDEELINEIAKLKSVGNNIDCMMYRNGRAVSAVEWSISLFSAIISNASSEDHLKSAYYIMTQVNKLLKEVDDDTTK